MTEERNNGLHPRHPGIGHSTSLISAVGDEPEQGGFFVFLPSGRTKIIGWRSAAPITPTLEAAKKYAAQVVESLQKEGAHDDIDRTNWTSVTAAVQRVILDFNDRIRLRIGDQMARQFAGKRVH